MTKPSPPQRVPSLTGLVLAGGQSRRMGRDKAAMPWHGESLLAHQVRLLDALCGRVVVSGRYDGFDCIADVLPGMGALSGLHAAGRAFPGQALLVVPVDMPLLTPGLLAGLIGQGVPCHFQSSPLPAYFPDTAALDAAIAALRASGRYAIRGLHALLGSLPLAMDAARPALANINTPEQWRDSHGG